MKILEMENREEIVLLLISFFEDNNDYSQEKVNRFIKENEILNGIDPEEIFQILEEMEEYKEKGLIIFNEKELEEVEDDDYEYDDFDDYEYEEVEYDKPISCEPNKKNLKESIKHNCIILGKGFLFILDKFLKFLLKNIIKLGNYLLNKKVNVNKQILLYKKITQKELDGAREDLIKADEQRKADYEKIILKLTRRNKVIPIVNVANMLKFALKGIVHDIKVLLVFIVYCYIVVKIIVNIYGLGWEFGIYTLFFIGGFLLLYSIITIFKIKKLAEDNAELQDFLWEDFKYGNGLVTSFHNVFDNMDYNEEEDFDDMSIEELERLVVGDIDAPQKTREEVSSNPYSKEWKEIFEDLFSVKGDFTIPKIMEVNERTEVHVMNHKNIDFSKVKKKSNEIRQYLGKEIYQLIPDYDDDIRQIGVEIITKPIPSKYTIHDMPKPSNKSSVIIGLGIKGWVEWDLENPDSAHCLLVGGTGSGKSRLMFHLIKQFIEQDFLVLFGDYKKLTFGRYSKRGYRVATENTQIASILSDLHEEMMRRNELFLKEGVEKLSEYNKLHPDNPLPRIVFLIDEFATFSNDTEIFDGKGLSKDEENEGAYKDYENILRVGRSAGIHLLIALQDPLATSIGGETLKGKARNLFDYKICGRISREEYSETVLGKGDTRASKINKFGRFYISETSKDTAYQIVSPLVDDNTVAYLTENTLFNKYSDYKIGSLNTSIKEIEIEEEPVEELIDTDKQTHNTFEEKTAKDYL